MGESGRCPDGGWAALLLPAIALGAILSSCAGSRLVDSASDASVIVGADNRPPGIGMRDSERGPIFTDEAGMTLYLWREEYPCKATRERPDDDLHPLIKIYTEHLVPACAEQWPPLLISGSAQPLGDWSVVTRSEGAKQWAYKGLPVVRSYKDQLPGDINALGYGRGGGLGGASPTLAAPPMRLPSGISVNLKNGVGLVAFSAQSNVLYTLPASGARARLRDAGPGKWRRLPASENAKAFGDWSITRENDGTKVWAYRGQPLFTYVGDHEQNQSNGMGVDGADLVILKPVPRPPSEVSIYRTPLGPVYTDARGMTLYAFSCSLPVPGLVTRGDRYSCDDGRDDASQREQFCPGTNRCAQIWRPLQARANARPQGGAWSVAVIPDPVNYPLRWVPAGSDAEKAPGAIKVVTHYGRALYASTADHEPGDFWGGEAHQNTGQRWSAVIAGEADGR
jgi:predicted lipoprotein with Yx(FWY)xxD motif